jgi:hypothetical protein
MAILLDTHFMNAGAWNCAPTSPCIQTPVVARLRDKELALAVRCVR